MLAAVTAMSAVLPVAGLMALTSGTLLGSAARDLIPGRRLRLRRAQRVAQRRCSMRCAVNAAMSVSRVAFGVEP